MDCGKGQIVKYVNGDTKDLRRDNLCLSNGQGKHRARDIIEPRHRLSANRPIVQHVYEDNSEVRPVLPRVASMIECQ